MVFKVKRKAAAVYGEQVYISTLSQPITRKTNARFNWPYDHFSLIEYASVDFSMSLGKPTEKQEDEMNDTTSIGSLGEKVPPESSTDSNEGEIPETELSQDPVGTFSGPGSSTDSNEGERVPGWTGAAIVRRSCRNLLWDPVALGRHSGRLLQGNSGLVAKEKAWWCWRGNRGKERTSEGTTVEKEKFLLMSRRGRGSNGGSGGRGSGGGYSR